MIKSGQDGAGGTAGRVSHPPGPSRGIFDESETGMDCEFLIIGGGIAGISAAARLAPSDKVIVLEAEAALAHHASGRSAAL